ncbi:DUF1461 domain-containing protein [Candidatus Woesearchaeota archaeon]|nr:DUF1461 domain-containing protein [Candidatus Woesearchaeota archaeon]
MKQYLRFFFIANIIIFVILFSSAFHVFNNEFYSQKFEQNGAYDTFGKDKVDEVNSQVFEYFLLKNNLETDFFDNREKKHLEDVRFLFIAGYILLFLTFIVLILFIYFYRKDLFNLLLISGIFGLFFVTFVVILSLTDFDFLFIAFHKIFFTQGTWSFDSNLVQVYTYDLFYSIFLRILITSTILFLMAILAFLIKNRLKY